MSDAPARPRRAPIPVTVLTGFLGAGKTTLLNRLLGDPLLADAAVIINEFGDISIDHLLVASADEGVVQLASGCICCTVRGELATTLEGFIRDLDNGRLDRLSRVVIETTGLADPLPVLQTILAHPYLALRFAVDGVVTLVDAVHGAATLDAHEEAVRQVALADRLVISKTDLADAAPLLGRLGRLNPGAAVLDAARGEATPAALLGSPLDPCRPGDAARWLNLPSAEHHHDHDGHDHDGHDHSHAHAHAHAHNGRFRTVSLAAEGAIPLPALLAFLDLLDARFGARLLRLKGLVYVDLHPDRPLVVHAVQGLFHPPVPLAAWPDADRRTRLVLILDGVSEAPVRALFDAVTSAPRPDTPDAAALVDNPLALAGWTGP